MMANECERCGYPAPSLARLIKHLKDGTQCRAIKSRISIPELLCKVQPPPPSEVLKCVHCNLQCKSKGGLTRHMKQCKHKDNATTNTQDNNGASTSATTTTPPTQDDDIQNAKNTSYKHVYFHKNVVVHKALHPFHHEIEWDTFDIDEQFFLDCLECKAHGIIELFTFLHRHPNHDNIKWSSNKLVVFNGKGWVEASDALLVKHIGFIYSILEEKWFDYQSNIRCGVVQPKDALDHCIQKDIDKFIYDDIVDDESVFFHCKDVLYEYLETLKD